MFDNIVAKAKEACTNNILSNFANRVCLFLDICSFKFHLLMYYCDLNDLFIFT